MNVNKQNADVALTAGADCIVIKGFTEEGKRFRPSDWAERLATAVGQCGADRRVRFHPRVRLATIDGEKCVIIDRALEEEEPLLFEFLMRFAQSNQLQTESKAGFGHERKHQVRAR
jgi:Protein of unknown function (DUF3579)